MSRSRRVIVDVARSGEEWAVFLNRQVISVHPTKAKALVAGRKTAKAYPLSSMRVREVGRVVDELYRDGVRVP